MHKIIPENERIHDIKNYAFIQQLAVYPYTDRRIRAWSILERGNAQPRIIIFTVQTSGSLASRYDSLVRACSLLKVYEEVEAAS